MATHSSTPLSGRRGQQAPEVSGGMSVEPVATTAVSEARIAYRFSPQPSLGSAEHRRLQSNNFADRALFTGAHGTDQGDQLLAEALAYWADFFADAAAREHRKTLALAQEARSVARPPSRRAR